MNETQAAIPENPHWPEAPRSVPLPRDRFPTGLFLGWFLPGLVGGLILLGLYVWLEQRAGRELIYLASDRSLGVVRADGSGDRAFELRGVSNALLGRPQWSPQGGQFAMVISDTSSLDLLLVSSETVTPTRITLSEPVLPVLASQAWAPSGNTLAVLNVNPFDTTGLQLINPAQNQVLTTTLALDPAAPTAWHPQRDELLVTAFNPERVPELFLVTPDGQSRPFAPADNMFERREGAWSPDGGRVAYIGQIVTGTLRTLLVANADGSNPQEIVADGVNYNPIWAPRGDLIFFTRLVTTTGEYDLYQVQADGQNIQRVDSSFPPQLFALIDQSSLISWAPDNSRMFFQSYNQNNKQVILRIADYNGANPLPILNEPGAIGDLAVRWSPTSRGVLLSSELNGIRMRWLDREEPQLFADGNSPTWEP